MASRAFAPYARQGPFGLPFGRGLAILIGSALACALLAFGLAQVGSAGLLVGAGGLVLLFGLLLVRNKSLLLLVAFGLGLQLVFHKSIGTQSALVSSGPLAIYVTSLDLLVVALYGLWFVQGGIFGDLGALRRSGVSSCLCLEGWPRYRAFSWPRI